jgi:hypothetical protein
MGILDHTSNRVRTNLLSTSAILAATVLFGMAQPGAAQIPLGADTVTDSTSCGVTPVTIARTPQVVRVQRLFPDGTSVITIDGIFANVLPGTTFHVTHVSGMFFTDGPQDSQIRLYKGGVITAGFNSPEDSFHQDNSTIQSKTINQPVDMYFSIGNDPGEWDLQLIRQKSTGVATGIAEFWGYLTVDTCPARQ